MKARYSRSDMILKRNKKRIRTEIRIVYDEILNLAEGEMVRRFKESLERGELLEYHGSQDEMHDLLRAAVDKYFEIAESEARNALPGS